MNIKRIFGLVLMSLIWYSSVSLAQPSLVWQKFQTACGTALNSENWKAAENPCKQAVQEGEKIEPKLFLDSSLNNLALVYLHQTRYSEAEPLLKRSLELRQKEWGESHPLVIQRLSMMAAVSRKVNKPKEAQALEAKAKQAEATCEKEITAEERKAQPQDPCQPSVPDFLR